MFWCCKVLFHLSSLILTILCIHGHAPKPGGAPRVHETHIIISIVFVFLVHCFVSQVKNLPGASKTALAQRLVNVGVFFVATGILMWSWFFFRRKTFLYAFITSIVTLVFGCCTMYQLCVVARRCVLFYLFVLCFLGYVLFVSFRYHRKEVFY